LGITVSFLGIHKWEPDIYVGFSPALHLQWGGEDGAELEQDGRKNVGRLLNLLSLRQICTAKKKCQKFETNIPRKGISGPESQFPHSCVCERIIYISTIGPPFLLEEICGPILGIYKSLTDT
jgi:hypothetical protein